MNDDKKNYILHAEPAKIALTGGTAKGTMWDGALNRMKRIRDAIGYTHQKQETNFAAWHSLATSFHKAALVLEEFKDRVPSDSRPFAFNAALSLELIFKAILAKKEISIPKGQGGHDLQLLSSKAEILLSASQMATLELMTEEIIWAGRYPAPNKPTKWDEYHDRILERHIIRSQIGNVSSTRANPDTFPDWKNYKKIWDTAVVELGIAE